jgi:hypothetical protein
LLVAFGAAFHRKCIEIVVARSAGLSWWIVAIPLFHPKSERLTGKPELTGIGGQLLVCRPYGKWLVAIGMPSAIADHVVYATI